MSGVSNFRKLVSKEAHSCKHRCHNRGEPPLHFWATEDSAPVSLLNQAEEEGIIALLPNAGSASSIVYLYSGWDLIACVKPRETRTDDAAWKFRYSESQRARTNNAGTGMTRYGITAALADFEFILDRVLCI